VSDLLCQDAFELNQRTDTRKCARGPMVQARRSNVIRLAQVVCMNSFMEAPNDVW